LTFYEKGFFFHFLLELSFHLSNAFSFRYELAISFGWFACCSLLLFVAVDDSKRSTFAVSQAQFEVTRLTFANVGQQEQRKDMKFFSKDMLRGEQFNKRAKACKLINEWK